MRRSTGRVVVACALAWFALTLVSRTPPPRAVSHAGDAAAAPRRVDAPVGVLSAATNPDWARVLVARSTGDDVVAVGATVAAMLLAVGLLGWLRRDVTGGPPGRARRARTRGRAPPHLRFV